MMRDLYQQPQQQPSKPQRLWPKLPGPRLGLCYDFGMQPHPHIAQDQSNAHKQQTQDGVSATGADARLMHLPIRRLNAKAAAIGGTNPPQGPMRDAPGGIQQGFSLVTPPLASRGVTDDGEVKSDAALWRTLQGIGGPLTLLVGRQRIGPGRPSRRRGLFPPFDRWHNKGPLSRDEVLD